MILLQYFENGIQLPHVKFLLYMALFHKLVIFQLPNTKFCANQKMCKFSTRGGGGVPWSAYIQPELLACLHPVFVSTRKVQSALIYVFVRMCCSEVQRINVTSQSGQNRCYV